MKVNQQHNTTIIVLLLLLLRRPPTSAVKSIMYDCNFLKSTDHLQHPVPGFLVKLVLLCVDDLQQEDHCEQTNSRHGPRDSAIRHG